MIVDSHCHAGAGDGLSGPWDTRASLDRYLPRARAAGIGHVVLIPAFHSDYRVAHRELARIVASNPRFYSAYAMVHPSRDARRVAHIVREAIEGFGFRGIKVHRHDGRITREICDVARSHRAPVLYDVMGQTAQLELIASEYPDVTFIVPHLGSFGDDWRAHTSLIDIMSRCPNVFADTSGVRRFDFLVETVRRAGPRQLLFGSDGPWLHPGVELAKIRALGLRPESERLVLGDNWRRITADVIRGPTLRAETRPGTSEEHGDPWATPQFV